jgi:hypothetical protein
MLKFFYSLKILSSTGKRLIMVRLGLTKGLVFRQSQKGEGPLIYEPVQPIAQYFRILNSLHYILLISLVSFE